jgi:hypothetical protein
MKERIVRLCRLMCGGGYAHRSPGQMIFGLCPWFGRSPDLNLVFSEGHRPSAHQAAKPL